MVILLQVVLAAFNIGLAALNFSRENFGVAMLNSGAAGLCLGFAISLIILAVFN